MAEVRLYLPWNCLLALGFECGFDRVPFPRHVFHNTHAHSAEAVAAEVSRENATSNGIVRRSRIIGVAIGYFRSVQPVWLSAR